MFGWCGDERKVAGSLVRNVQGETEGIAVVGELHKTMEPRN